MGAHLNPFARSEDELHRNAAYTHTGRHERHAISLRVDRNWRLTKISPGAADYLHVSSDQALGRSISTIVRPMLGSGFAKKLRSVCANHQTIRFDYFSETKRPVWLEVSCDRLPDGLLVSLRDVTRRRVLENDVRLMVASLLKQQDDGRRKLSRRLHDNVAQDLVLALMELEGLRNKTKAAERTALLHEIWTVLRRALTEVRTMSNRVYPPMLDESGIVTSLRWLIREFKDRSGAKVKLEVSRRTPRRSHSVELAIFSVVEEVFKLIERNGFDKRVEVDLAILSRMATVRVRAIGRALASVIKAFDEIAVTDSGILQLWTRIRQLGGTIEAKAAARSATLSVSLPFPAPYGRQPRFSGKEIFRRALRRQQAPRPRLAIRDGASAKQQGRVSRP